MQKAQLEIGSQWKDVHAHIVSKWTKLEQKVQKYEQA